jgi:hypothetical protein
MINKLRLVCEKHILPDSANAVIKEPYIPFIPDNWNGFLVLAESQNLSVTNLPYVEGLSTLSTHKKILRLNLDMFEKLNVLHLEDGAVGVQPWDDGSIKLALESAFSVCASKTAVSNAVLWSQRSNTGANINPEESLQSLSAAIWAKLLTTLKPSLLICCGKLASSVIRKTEWNGNIVNLRLPASTAMSRISGMFSIGDLRKRYPEVHNVAASHPEWLENGYPLNKIFYACHAVSLYKNKIDFSVFADSNTR